MVICNLNPTVSSALLKKVMDKIGGYDNNNACILDLNLVSKYHINLLSPIRTNPKLMYNSSMLYHIHDAHKKLHQFAINFFTNDTNCVPCITDHKYFLSIKRYMNYENSHRINDFKIPDYLEDYFFCLDLITFPFYVIDKIAEGEDRERLKKCFIASFSYGDEEIPTNVNFGECKGVKELDCALSYYYVTDTHLSKGCINNILSIKYREYLADITDYLIPRLRLSRYNLPSLLGVSSSNLLDTIYNFRSRRDVASNLSFFYNRENNYIVVPQGLGDYNATNFEISDHLGESYSRMHNKLFPQYAGELISKRLITVEGKPLEYVVSASPFFPNQKLDIGNSLIDPRGIINIKPDNDNLYVVSIENSNYKIHKYD